MALSVGTHTIADLAANTFAGTTVQEFGIENMNTAIQNDLTIHNERVEQMLAEMVEPTTERSTVYGTNADGEMHQKDEFTRGPTQKISFGSKVEMPLDAFQYAVGWTADFLRRASVQDMARITIASRKAHIKRLQYDIKAALFNPTNYTWRDRLVDNLDLAVKRLVNADSGAIPNGPNGETFDPATHTHYNTVDWAGSNAAARLAAVQALIQDVVEHGHGADVRLYINRAQETDVRALTGFAALPPPNIVLAPGGTTVVGQGTLDITRTDNRLIGYLDGNPVYTRPWVPSNYMLTFAAGDAMKPLRIRYSTREPRGLFVAGMIITHPLQAEYMEAFHGVAVYTRTNAAILYLGSADTYAAPTLTQ